MCIASLQQQLSLAPGEPLLCVSEYGLPERLCDASMVHIQRAGYAQLLIDWQDLHVQSVSHVHTTSIVLLYFDLIKRKRLEAKKCDRLAEGMGHIQGKQQIKAGQDET